MTEAISDHNSYLDSETKKKLETLDTNYSKVNWDVQCSPFENHPGLVISVVSYADEYDIYELVVGVTNLLDTPIMIDVKGEAIAKVGVMTRGTSSD